MRVYINVIENKTNFLHVTQNSLGFAVSLVSHNRAASLAETIHRPISSSRLRAEKEKILPGLDVRDVPSPSPSSHGLTIPGEKDDDGGAVARLPGTLFSVPGTFYPRSSTYWLPSRLPSSRVRSDGGRRLPHPERPGYRTNGEFDDPNGGSESARAPPDTKRYSNADLGSRLGRGSSRADRHSRYPSCRGIPRFVNIPPNRSFRLSRAFAMRAGWLCTWP